MIRSQALQILKPFLDFILSLEKNRTISIPLLYELAALGMGKASKGEAILMKRIKRRYLRLCRVQEELGRLDFKKAAPGTSPEDFVFSQIDFSRYREIHGKTFNIMFLEGLADFDEAFLKENFRLGREEAQSLLENSYEKVEGLCILRQDSPLVFSLMRTLETSLEDMPLFSYEEIEAEVNKLSKFTERAELLMDIDALYPLLIFCLDGIAVTHRDGMKTKLFVSEDGALSGTFQPGGKPWTRVLNPLPDMIP